MADYIALPNREAVMESIRNYFGAGTPIDALALSGRTHNLVTSADKWRGRGKPPRTIGDLAAIRDMELMRVPGLGKVALREIKVALARHLADHRLEEAGYEPMAARRQPKPPAGLNEWEPNVMAADCPAVCLMDRASVRALLRYVRRLEREVMEMGEFW